MIKKKAKDVEIIARAHVIFSFCYKKNVLFLTFDFLYSNYYLTNKILLKMKIFHKNSLNYKIYNVTDSGDVIFFVCYMLYAGCKMTRVKVKFALSIFLCSQPVNPDRNHSCGKISVFAPSRVRDVRGVNNSGSVWLWIKSKHISCNFLLFLCSKSIKF